MKKKLYLVTGFLGSGKTTLMKQLLMLNENEKTGVIVNEFGKENVDGKLLHNNRIKMTEISNGSIFCSCRSDLFIDALVELGKAELDSVFIETSGMSNPWSMPEVIEIANTKTDDAYQYMGCMTVVDCRTFMKLSSMINAIPKQIVFADYILLNKSDLVTDLEKEKIKSTVMALNQTAIVEFTSYCQSKHINNMLNIEHIPDKGKEAFSTAAQSGVRKVLIEFNQSTDNKKFMNFLQEIAIETYRIKGFIVLDNEHFSIDCVNDQISINPTSYRSMSNYIVIISDSKKPLKVVTKRIYENIFNESPNIKE